MDIAKRLLLLAALPALAGALGLILLRLISWPLWSNVDPVLGLGYDILILVLLAFALLGSAFAGQGARHRNLLGWGSVVLSFAVIAMVDRDYDAWQYREIWGEASAETSAASVDGTLSGTGNARSDTIILERRFDGHYYIDVGINGTTAEFLVDTGASGVAITVADARRAGVRIDRLNFDITVSTAAGTTQAAGVIIPELTLPGGHRFTDVPALVLRGGDRSLLGMQVLEEFSSVEIRQDRLVLRR